MVNHAAALYPTEPMTLTDNVKSKLFTGNKFSPAFIILLTLDNASKKHDKVKFFKVFGLGFLSSYYVLIILFL